MVITIIVVASLWTSVAYDSRVTQLVSLPAYDSDQLARVMLAASIGHFCVEFPQLSLSFQFLRNTCNLSVLKQRPGAIQNILSAMAAATEVTATFRAEGDAEAAGNVWQEKMKTLGIPSSWEIEQKAEESRGDLMTSIEEETPKAPFEETQEDSPECNAWKSIIDADGKVDMKSPLGSKLYYTICKDPQLKAEYKQCKSHTLMREFRAKVAKTKYDDIIFNVKWNRRLSSKALMASIARFPACCRGRAVMYMLIQYV